MAALDHCRVYRFSQPGVDAALMDAQMSDACIARIAAAIAEPARARMLCCLLDGHARTGTELAVVAEISPAAASTHLARLTQRQLVRAVAQGRYRYYSLENPRVAAALNTLVARDRKHLAPFVPSTPSRLRWGRTCYDHMAGTIAVSLHDGLLSAQWMVRDAQDAASYSVTALGSREMVSLGVDAETLRAGRRRLACPCLDWSERRPHVGGGVGAALLNSALQRKWVVKDLASRALRITKRGKRELLSRFGVEGES